MLDTMPMEVAAPGPEETRQETEIPPSQPRPPFMLHGGASPEKVDPKPEIPPEKAWFFPTFFFKGISTGCFQKGIPRAEVQMHCKQFRGEIKFFSKLQSMSHIDRGMLQVTVVRNAAMKQWLVQELPLN